MCVSDLGLGLSTMQGVEMVNSALWGRPWVGENLEHVKIVAQSVGSHQQHSCNKHTHTHDRSLHGWRQRWGRLLLPCTYSIRWVLLPFTRMSLYFAFGVCLSCFMLMSRTFFLCYCWESLKSFCAWTVQWQQLGDCIKQWGAQLYMTQVTGLPVSVNLWWHHQG